MAKFITGPDLEKVIYDIIWEAKETLLIVSPFIKLDNYFKELFDKHVDNPKIHLLIIFGKNTGVVSKSLSANDFDFFKKFSNVSILYVPNLHAKYFANESAGVITSINLYDYSFKNNIEFGVYSEVSVLSKITKTTDGEAWNYCREIADEADVVFIKRPVYEKKLFTKNFIKTEILHDNTEYYYLKGAAKGLSVKKLVDFPDEIDFSNQNNIRPERSEVESKQVESKAKSEVVVSNVTPSGYCIRTGVEMPFDIKKPLCYEAYKSWSKYKDQNYEEKFCHFSGEPSAGKTSVSIQCRDSNRLKNNSCCPTF